MAFAECEAQGLEHENHLLPGATVTFTSSGVSKTPSSEYARSVYVPGALKVTVVVARPASLPGS